MAQDRKLKVLFLPAWYPSEKNPVAGIFIKEYANAVFRYNEVVVLYSEAIGENIEGIYKVISDKKEGQLRTIRIKYRKSPIPKTTYLIHAWSIRAVFKKLLRQGWKPDIIHAHVFTAGALAAILGKIYKIPFVITEHYSKFATHSLSFFQRRVARLAMSKAKVLLPVGDNLRRDIEDYYGIKNSFCVVPNVVNTEVFYPSSPQASVQNYGKKRMLLVAILTQRKGISYLLESLSQIKEKRQDFFLDIIGDGPDRKEYEKLAGKLGLEEIVKFHGLKSKEEIAKFMRKSDFFIQPSLYETFGVTYIEAMACGKPIVATHLPVLQEKINKNRGILVPPKDIDGLASAIDYMLDHYRDYSPEKISQYARENFSYEVVGKKLDDIYRNILRENFRDYPAGNSDYKIKIRDDWKVLDVGSGHNPHPRANVVLDKYIEDDRERSGKSIKARVGQQFVKGDACSMPFKGKEFDYVIASHIAEHIDDPEKFCKELIRVGERGYIETPSRFSEMILGEVFHKWYVYEKNGTLIFEKKNKHHLLDLLGKVFYAIYYVNIKREDKPTLYFHNEYLRDFSDRLAHYFLRKPWVKFKKLTYTCFEWRDKFNYKILD